MAYWLIESDEAPEEKSVQVEACWYCGSIYLTGWQCNISHGTE